MKEKLTIVIPCKNEENYIGNLLKSLSNQYDILSTRIIISDAGSTDSTLDIIKSFQNLNIEVIEGGLPAFGRNKGAYLSTTEYVLFIDSDIEIKNEYTISDSLLMMEDKKLDMLSAMLNSHYLIVKFLYKINNIIVYLSRFDNPFCVGSYMMVRLSTFKSLGGFPEDVMHCEDYLFSKKINSNRFGIIDRYVYSDDRRFKKMGYWKMIKYIFYNILNRNNYDYFKKDINYWL